MEENKQYILCAAVYYDDGIERANQPRNIKTGIVVCGWRHHNCFATMHAIYPNREYMKTEIQGFIDNKGYFWNRKESTEIAKIAKQVSENFKGDLFSEDLY